MQSVLLSPIGIIESPYLEKFAVPRQPGLVPAAKGRLHLLPPFADPHAVEGLTAFSHVWLTFLFHQNLAQGWRPKVRPPRLGGNQSVGVFASRSPFRPNGLGLSVVALEGIRYLDGGVQLELGGLDLVDGTPVVDIKPYLPYVDSLPAACGGYAPEAPVAALTVRWQEPAWALRPEGPLIAQVLAQDPRPAYKQGKPDSHIYGVKLAGFNVRFRITEPHCDILELTPLA